MSQVLEGAVHLSFGTDEHLTLWRERLGHFEQLLLQFSLFNRVVVLDVPWAVFTTDGAPSPWSMGVRARDANNLYRRYYDELRSRGFRMIELPVEVALADPRHRWSLAPFHYSAFVYREGLRHLREEFGFTGLVARDELDEPRDADQEDRTKGPLLVEVNAGACCVQ